MPLKKKKKPGLLIIEGAGPTENIILGLENLEINNESLREAIRTNNSQLDKIRNIIGKL
jgi:hypothetical protein